MKSAVIIRFSLVCLAFTPIAWAAPVSIEEAVTQILERSPEISSAKARLEATRSRALPARLVMLPTLSFDAKQSWNNQWSTDALSRQVEGVSTLNLFHWGADLAAWRAADADVESGEYELSVAELAHETTGVTAIIEYISRTQERGVHTKLVAMERELLDIAQKRFKAGLLPQQEINQVSIDVENATSALVDVELSLTESQAILESLLGNSDVSVDWPWKSRIESIAIRLPQKLSPDLSLRPDWQSALSRVKAEDERHTRTVRLLFPSVDTVFAFGHYVSPFSEPVPAWSASIQIQLPFFDHFQSYSNARAQSFVREAAEADLLQAQRSAKADWSIARNSFEKALETARSREKILSLSRQLYQDNLKRFQAGRISANDLAINQKRLLDSELFAIQGWKTAHLSLLKLCHAQGVSILACEK